MNGATTHRRPLPNTKSTNGHFSHGRATLNMSKKKPSFPTHGGAGLGNAHFLKWTAADVVGLPRHHPLAFVFGACLFLFMAVEYTLAMIPATAPPYDLGFAATVALNRFVAARPALNTVLAFLNTVFVGMQMVYIAWTFLIEGRPRATMSTLFMFTCRGILGYATQLPLPQDFLSSGADFPVGNVSFFLFFSGHVAAAIIASLDMRRMQRWELAYTFDALNVLQIIRLLTTRGHYTIDLAVGVMAGMLFDSLAGKYVDRKKTAAILCNGDTNGGYNNGSIKEI